MFEFQKKLLGIAEALGCSPNPTALAKYLELPLQSVKDAFDAEACTPAWHKCLYEALRKKGWVFAPVTSDVTSSAPPWPEWRVPSSAGDGVRVDAALPFLKRFKDENSSKFAVAPMNTTASGSIPAPQGNLATAATTAAANVGSAPVKLFLKEELDPVGPIDDILGNVELLLPDQRIDAGTDGHLTVTVRCHAATIEGVKLAITCCLLSLKRSRQPDRSAVPDRSIPAEVKNAAGIAVTVERIAAGRAPKVRLQSRKGQIGEVQLPYELWSLIEARADDTFDCEMRIFLRDCAVVGAEEDASLARVSGAPIEDQAMEKIRKRFLERTVVPDDGVAVLHVRRSRLAPESNR